MAMASYYSSLSPHLPSQNLTLFYLSPLPHHHPSFPLLCLRNSNRSNFEQWQSKNKNVFTSAPFFRRCLLMKVLCSQTLGCQMESSQEELLETPPISPQHGMLLFSSRVCEGLGLLVEKAGMILASSESKVKAFGILFLFALCLAAVVRGCRHGGIRRHALRLPLACISSSVSPNSSGSSSTVQPAEVSHLGQLEQSPDHELLKGSEVLKSSTGIALDVGAGDAHISAQCGNEYPAKTVDETVRFSQVAGVDQGKDSSLAPPQSNSHLLGELEGRNEGDFTEATENGEDKKTLSKLDDSVNSLEDDAENRPADVGLLDNSDKDVPEADAGSSQGQSDSTVGISSQTKSFSSQAEALSKVDGLERMKLDPSVDMEAQRSSEDLVAASHSARKNKGGSAANANTGIGYLPDKEIKEYYEEWRSIQKDPELQISYEEWKARPYVLPVPMRIAALQASVPYRWLKEFLQSQGKKRAKVSVEYWRSLRGMVLELAWAAEKDEVRRRSIMAADLVTVGDAWLGSAITVGLIEPIKNIEELDFFQSLGSRWQKFLRRNKSGQIDQKGLVWGVPYRCGCTVIAYRKDKFSKANLPPVTDWQDIWKPELAAKVSMVDSPREVVGAVLKSLGGSYNCKSFDEVVGGREAVKQRYLGLQKQVRIFDSKDYLKALGAGDVWVAVGWSSDVIPYAQRMSNIAVVVPSSGSSFWADLWAIPAATSLKGDDLESRIQGPSPLIFQWLDFCLQPARASSFKSGLLAGDSPLLLANQSCCASSHDLQNSEVHGESVTATLDRAGESPITIDTLEGFMSRESIERGEFVEPLSKSAMDDYEWLLSEHLEIEKWPKDFWEWLKGSFQLTWSRVPSAGVRL